MNNMRSIMKETFNVDPNKKLTINVDTTKQVEFNLRKFVRYVQRNQVDITQKDVQQAIQTTGFLANGCEEVKLPDDLVTHLVSDSTIQNSATYLYKDEVLYPSRDEPGEIYLLLNKANTLTTKEQHGVIYYSKFPNIRMRRYNVDKFVASAKLMALLEDEDYDFAFRAYYKREPSERDLLKAKERVFYALISGTLQGMRLGLAKVLNVLLYERVMEVYDRELNIRLMDAYNQETGKDYAKAFQTKKNIPLKIQKAMADSTFKSYGFKFVEFDADTDLSKVGLIEREWIDLYKKLPKSKTSVDLRFRKLGNYRANGVYFPTYNCIAVDLRAIDSFIHEYAHHLDYTYKQTPLSLEPEFLDIIRGYRKNWDRLETGSSVAQGNYYKTPTEIFARAYEVYLASKGYKTNLLKSISRYQQEEPYMAITKDEGLAKQVIQYFDSVFN